VMVRAIDAAVRVRLLVMGLASRERIRPRAPQAFDLVTWV